MTKSTDTVASDVLARRAMIVTLNVSQWSGRRLDRKITDEVNNSHGADSDAGRYNKALLDKSAMAKIQKIAGEARSKFLEKTLPWVDDGGRIMSNHGHTEFSRWFNSIKADFDAAVDQFIAAYPEHINAARTRLSGMFDETEYPRAEDLRGKFRMRITIMPVPAADDFRVAMSEAQAAEIKADIERNVRDATATAVRDIYKRIHDVTERMVDRLNGYEPAGGPGQRAKNTFRDSLVGNVQDLIDLLPALNITNDPNVTAMIDKLKPLVEYKPETLRTDEGKRADTAHQAQAVLDSISDFLA